MFCQQQTAQTGLKSEFYFFTSCPNFCYPHCKHSLQVAMLVNFITAGQPLEHEEQNVALIAPFLQMHPDPIKPTSQCAAMAAVVVGRGTTLVWLL